MKASLFIFSIFFLFQTCSQKRQISSDTPKEYENTTTTKRRINPGKGERCCRDQKSYIPDTLHANHNPEKILRVNFHFLYDSEGKNNVPEAEAAKKAKSVLYYANYKFRRLCKMNLPLGNDTPVLPIGFQMELTPKPNTPKDTGIYLHRDEDLYAYVKRGKNENRPSRAVINKYGVQLDTVLNIFVMAHHPDSVNSKQYKADVTGIALGNAVKVSGWYHTDTEDWELAKTLMHEVGHILGLAHSWGRDGCDDTPPNPNCWYKTNNGSACDSLFSNNLMDYNAGKCALSPEQLGRMHKNMSIEGQRGRKFLKPLHCDLNGKKSIIITDSVHWKGAKDVYGNLTIADGGVLTMSCRVSMPAASTITVMPGGTLILNNNRLHNACGKEWNGIKVYKRKRKTGKVILNGEPIFENAADFDLEPVKFHGKPMKSPFRRGI